MKTILAICVALIFCSIACGETFGLGQPDPPSQLASVVMVEPIADTFGLGVSGPAGEPVVYDQEVVSGCPGGVCPLPRVTVTSQPVVVSQVTCPNRPVPTISTRAMPVAAIDCPNCPPVVSRSTTVSRPVLRGYRARWTWPGNLARHLQAEHGIDTSGMSQAELMALHDSLHESDGIVRSWNGPVVRAMRNRPVLFPRIRSALFRR